MREALVDPRSPIEKQWRITFRPCGVLVEDRERVVVGVAGVDHHRLADLAGDLDLRLERASPDPRAGACSR